jgi:hypothetical protein
MENNRNQGVAASAVIATQSTYDAQTEQAMDQIAEATMHQHAQTFQQQQQQKALSPSLQLKNDLVVAARGDAPVAASLSDADIVKSLEQSQDVLSSSSSSSVMMNTGRNDQEEVVAPSSPSSKGRLRSAWDSIRTRAKGLVFSSPSLSYEGEGPSLSYEGEGQGNLVGGIPKDVVLGSSKANTPHDKEAGNPRVIQARMAKVRHGSTKDEALGVIPQGREIAGLSNESILGSRNALKPNDGEAKSPQEIKARADKLRAKL